jgi:hypothetical protein
MPSFGRQPKPRRFFIATFEWLAVFAPKKGSHPASKPRQEFEGGLARSGL